MNGTESAPEKKSKWLAFFLALILGPIGFHNFYIGRWKRGFLQFALVVISVGAGLLITIPWAWTEAFLILISKYSLAPIKPKEAGPTTGYINSQKIKVSPLKEYLIAIFLLAPLLIGSVFFFGIPILVAILFYYLVGGLWNKITWVFIKSVLPLYASVFGGGKKFLIRFSEYSLPPTKTKAELFRATRKLSVTAIFVLFFLISLIAQSNLSMVTEGDIPDAVICDDGTFETDSVLCDDESAGTQCDSDCVMENTNVKERVLQAYSDYRVGLVLLLAPFITILIAPILVLKYSSLSIVDKETRSMSPIGEKANDLTNIAAGFGSVVIFFQTAWKISSAAAQDGDMVEGAYFVATILFFTTLLVYFTYSLIWIPILKFAKSFESHVLLLDNSLVESKGIEIHQLSYEENELRITPVNDNKIPPQIQMPPY